MILQTIFSFFLEIDKNLAIAVNSYGLWIYPILFLIIFCETGLVVTPFLPGDSLLFAAGTLAAIGQISIVLLLIFICIAAIVGDTINYLIGYYFGEKAFKSKSRWFKKEHLVKTQLFYEKYGGKTIILARFIPIIRTFAPFVAGIGKMNYSKFLFYNVIGGIAWVSFFLLGGYFLGSLPLIRDNLSLFLIGIIFLSLLPIPIEYFRERIKRKKLIQELNA
jgi:membrane-associated protein